MGIKTTTTTKWRWNSHGLKRTGWCEQGVLQTVGGGPLSLCSLTLSWSKCPLGAAWLRRLVHLGDNKPSEWRDEKEPRWRRWIYFSGKVAVEDAESFITEDGGRLWLQLAAASSWFTPHIMWSCCRVRIWKHWGSEGQTWSSRPQTEWQEGEKRPEERQRKERGAENRTRV